VKIPPHHHWLADPRESGCLPVLIVLAILAAWLF